MKRNFIFTLLAVCVLTSTNRLAAQDRDVVAGIPVNYDESKVGNYKETLPDPLVMLDGTPVTTAKQWMKKRRPEIVYQGTMALVSGDKNYIFAKN